LAYLLGRGRFRRGKERRRERGRLTGWHKAIDGAGGEEESGGGRESHDGGVVYVISNETMRRERNEKERERCGASGVLAVRNIDRHQKRTHMVSHVSRRECTFLIGRARVLWSERCEGLH
jgi:hypothetical protein